MEKENKDLENEIIDETNEEVNEENFENAEVEDKDINESNSEIEKLKTLNSELTDKLQRNFAEFDNFRKRNEKEKAQNFDNGTINTVEKILPVLDNFQRALNAEKNKDSDFYKGVEMINRQFVTLLGEIGVKEIEALNQQFDPNLHYAVSHEENEEFGENEVIEILQKGYTYKEKVIRFSMVKVAN